jgi:hypothetical protein
VNERYKKQDTNSECEFIKDRRSLFSAFPLAVFLLTVHLTSFQVTTPVAIMTSDAKGNHAHITELMESCNWFGRGRESFRLFR